MKSIYNSPKKLILTGIVFMVIGFSLAFFTELQDFACGLIFGSGLAYVGLGTQKLYNNA